jgi:beta-galactosidase
VRDNPSHAGHFIWTGVDYLGETMAFPNIGAYSGVVDAVDRPKNEAYQSASWWSTKPVLFIVRGAGGGAPASGGDAGLMRGVIAPTNDWSPANRSPHTEAVNVYSNCDEVELFLNGKSLGIKPRGPVDSVRTWAVAFEPGTLKGVARNQGQQVAAQELLTAGPAAKLTFTPSTKKLFADFDSLAHVTIAVADGKGVLVPQANNPITVALSGPGMLAALANGQLVAQDFRATTKPALFGQLVAYVRATGNSGPITLTASAEGLAPATMTFETAPARPGH